MPANDRGKALSLGSAEAMKMDFCHNIDLLRAGLK